MYQVFVARRNGSFNIIIRHVSGRIKQCIDYSAAKALELVNKVLRLGRIANTENSTRNYLDLLLSVN